MLSPTCSRRTLAANDFSIVERCSCGAVHLTIGAITLRLTASTIPALAQTLGDAARALVLHEAMAIAMTSEEVLS